MNVLIDFHHDELHESLLKLFEDRLKFNVYTPIGFEWQTNGYWNISNLPQTIHQYLNIDYKNKNDWIEIEPGVFHNNGCSRYRKYFKYITLNSAIEKKWDIIVSSHPNQFDYYHKFAQKYCKSAKLIMQLGNMMPIVSKNCKNFLNSTSTDYYLHQLKNANTINYSQEFDYSDLTNFVIPENKTSINTFLLYNDSHNKNLMDKIVSELNWESKSYGCGNKDGQITDYKELVNKIKNSAFVWHYKRSGDGYGHTLHKALFAGRVPLLNKRMYQFHRLMHLKFFEDGITYINCNHDNNLDLDLSSEVIIRKIRNFYENYDTNSKNIFERIRNIIDFDKEELEIRKFIENLRD